MTLPRPTSDLNFHTISLSDRRSFSSELADDGLRRRILRLRQLKIEYVAVDPGERPFSEGILVARPPSHRLAAEEERRLFLAMNAAKNIVAERRSRLSLERPDVELLEDLEWLWQRAALIRCQLIEGFFKLAVSVARRQVRRTGEADDLVGQACLTLIRAIERFDVARGFRFSTYATRAIQSELHRYVLRQHKRNPLPIDSDELTQVRDHRSSESDQIRHCAAMQSLEILMQRLECREAHVVRSRFGLMEHPGEVTLQSLADQFGVSCERVRQLERRALKKLRRLADELDQAGVLEQFVDNRP